MNLSYIFVSNLQFIAASIPNHSPYKLIELINYGAFIGICWTEWNGRITVASLSRICLALGREDHLVWIKIKKNDCHAIWLATICHEDDVRTDYRVDAERVQARQPSIRAPFFFLSRSVNIIVKRKSFMKLVDDRDNCASLCESLNLNLRWKKRKKRKKERKKRPKKNDEPDDPDVRINYANVYERLSGTRWLFRLGNIYIGYCVNTRLREVNLFFSFFKGRILFRIFQPISWSKVEPSKTCRASFELSI